MKVLKSSVIALMVSFGMFQSQANAGLLVGFVAGNPGVGALAGGVVGGAAGGASGLYSLSFGAGVLVTLAGVILDASFESGSTPDQLESAVSELLPMIEDREVIRDIAKQAQVKLLAGGKTLGKNEVRVIRFTDAEVAAFTDSLVMSGAELEEIKSVLQ